MHHSALLVVLFRVTTKTSGTFLSVSPLGVRYMDVSHKLHSSRLDWSILVTTEAALKDQQTLGFTEMLLEFVYANQ